MSDRAVQLRSLDTEWNTSQRWHGIERPYAAADVLRLRGSVQVEHSLARLGAEKFWRLLRSEPVIGALGCVTGNQAVQAVQSGLKAIYCSGWQVAGDGNSAGEMYPDQSLYPVDSVPRMIDRINNALLRTDQIHSLDGSHDIDWLVPVIADAEAGFGGNLNAYELTKAMIRAGAAGVHFEDQLSSAKKCGHMGGKVLVPTDEAINKLVAARLAADVAGVPTLVIARTDAEAANLLTSDHDPRDRPFLTGKRSAEGFFYVRNGIDQAIARGLAYAPFADLLWCETAKPDIEEARRFAEGIHALYPGKLLAYNCSPSFNWQSKLSAGEMRTWRERLAELGYRFQFITLAGWHALNLSMFELATAYRIDGMLGYSSLQ
jgi:isocitrate lyase